MPSGGILDCVMVKCVPPYNVESTAQAWLWMRYTKIYSLKIEKLQLFIKEYAIF